jgi:hypothetical protein
MNTRTSSRMLGLAAAALLLLASTLGAAEPIPLTAPEPPPQFLRPRNQLRLPERVLQWVRGIPLASRGPSRGPEVRIVPARLGPEAYGLRLIGSFD